MRLFAALLPPAPAADELAAAVRALHALPGADRLRWTGQESWHLTLAFYGEVGGDTLPELGERLARAAARARAPRLALTGAGRFGDRTLWTGADGDRTELHRLAQAAEAAGRRCGLRTEEGRRFHAHLTLARARRGRPVDLRPYVTALGGFAGGPWTAHELALVRSNPPAAGVPGAQPHYETVTAWPLPG
ncbi:RNA 2',3'-cyclic phosphodiesterase [Streptomyces sp. JJ36]|uniref:RNA 2',3'-cyclic phosphodiesterase n=1 Tax=Streptomyces sp. JJ36 TaxID=2736645 RepID=UPI001F00FFA8|nr:RNA 2',3'-cyclic phosphodiesterase [Streptomyces sp. JJ36]MCF6525473.1 RNA 2',3'-cyclic phosphodiesterase [Streptomyces sp. JJ36]